MHAAGLRTLRTAGRAADRRDAWPGGAANSVTIFTIRQLIQNL